MIINENNRQNLSGDLDHNLIERLVMEAQNGKVSAFGEIYDIYVEKIYRYIYFRAEKADALDITENTFLKAWENLKKYKKREGSTFTSWIFRIAHNLVVDHHRFKKDTVAIDPSISDQKNESNPEFVTEQAISRDGIKKALQKLKKPYQEVLTLAYLNELSNTEVARILGKSEGGLRVLKHRALQEMKKLLEEMNINY
ncbi:sigma-70 family RNA polymerase sigma factor [Candidatus Peregrinibacteria bacterium]|nr:sigma-70 family RNA polymerase sigma factor [Candidatus Peregrinibacteria bacterium]